MSHGVDYSQAQLSHIVSSKPEMKSMANKTSILTPDPWRLESIMTTQLSTQKSESTLGQV